MPVPVPLSVLLAAHNAESTIERAIGSICQQTFTDWELLVIDDASSDATREIAREYERNDSRVHLVRSAVRSGQSACLNIGFRASPSPLIARMDADDFSFSTRFEKQVGALGELPDVHILGTAAELVDDHGNSCGQATRPEDHTEIVRRMYKEIPVLHPSVMCRREVLEQHRGYDERLARANDLDLWLRAYRSFRFGNLAEPLIEYRITARPTLRTIAEGTGVLVRSAYRERKLHTHGWYGLRYAAAASLASAGLRRLRF